RRPASVCRSCPVRSWPDCSWPCCSCPCRWARASAPGLPSVSACRACSCRWFCSWPCEVPPDDRVMTSQYPHLCNNCHPSFYICPLMSAIEKDTPARLHAARKAVDTAMSRDHGRLLGLLSRWQGKPDDAAAEQAFAQLLERSARQRRQRAAQKIA